MTTERYDVNIVGAGPAGATTAYYLATESRQARATRVALLEKATFPRDKFCGDAWCAPALDILEDMGVLQKLEAEGLVRDTTSGGCGERQYKGQRPIWPLKTTINRQVLVIERSLVIPKGG